MNSSVAPGPARTVRGAVAAVEAAGGQALGLTLDEATRRYVAATVDALGGNKAEAARRLDVGRNTIGRILKGERDSQPGPGDDDG